MLLIFILVINTNKIYYTFANVYIFFIIYKNIKNILKIHFTIQFFFESRVLRMSKFEKAKFSVFFYDALSANF